MTAPHVVRRGELAGALGFEPGEFHGDDVVQAVLDAVVEAKQMREQLAGFREWLRAEERGGATVVRITEVRVFFGWPA